MSFSVFTFSEGENPPTRHGGGGDTSKRSGAKNELTLTRRLHYHEMKLLRPSGSKANTSHSRESTWNVTFNPVCLRNYYLFYTFYFW